MAPVVAENFLYAGAENSSASPVKEVTPPVHGGGGVCSASAYPRMSNLSTGAASPGVVAVSVY